jgi:hypothetical protein
MIPDLLIAGRGCVARVGCAAELVPEILAGGYGWRLYAFDEFLLYFFLLAFFLLAAGAGFERRRRHAGLLHGGG